MIAATGLVILLKSDPNNELVDFSAGATLKFDRWLRKTMENFFHAPKSYVCHLIAIYEFELELLLRNVQIGAK